MQWNNKRKPHWNQGNTLQWQKDQKFNRSAVYVKQWATKSFTGCNVRSWYTPIFSLKQMVGLTIIIYTSWSFCGLTNHNFPPTTIKKKSKAKTNQTVDGYKEDTENDKKVYHQLRKKGKCQTKNLLIKSRGRRRLKRRYFKWK